MAIGLYMDQHVPRSIAIGLRMRGVDVLTTQEDGTERLADSDLLDRATELGPVLFTFDDDLLAEASHRQKEKGTLAVWYIFTCKTFQLANVFMIWK